MEKNDPREQVMGERKINEKKKPGFFEPDRKKFSVSKIIVIGLMIVSTVITLVLGFSSWGEGNLYSQFAKYNIFADSGNLNGILDSPICLYIVAGLLCFSIVALSAYFCLKKNWMRIYGGSFIFFSMSFYMILLTGNVLLNIILGKGANYPAGLVVFCVSNIVTLILSMVTLLKNR